MKNNVLLLAFCAFINLHGAVLDSSTVKYALANKADSAYAIWLSSKYEQSLIHNNVAVADTAGGGSSGLSDAVIAQRLAVLDQRSPLDLRLTPEVKSSILFYLSKRKQHISRVLGRSTLYFPIFEASLDKYNLPIELRALPIIESALNPSATSPVGAKGLWQFMYATGKYQGLEISSYVDERMDPALSTDAACRYLKKMYDLFGNWELALAAYNAGPGNVSKAIRYSGGKTTFWEIRPYLPKETQNYIPTFIAAVYAINYASLHGIYGEPPPATFVEIDTVHAIAPVGLKDLMTVLSIDSTLLVLLNPQYKLQHVPGPKDGKVYSINLPKAAIPSYIENSDSLYAFAERRLKKVPVPTPTTTPSKPTGTRSTVRHYTVKSGDTLGAIARKYGVKVSDLQRWNGLRGTTIRIGQKLKIRK